MGMLLELARLRLGSCGNRARGGGGILMEPEGVGVGLCCDKRGWGWDSAGGFHGPEFTFIFLIAQEEATDVIGMSCSVVNSTSSFGTPNIGSESCSYR